VKTSTKIKWQNRWTISVGDRVNVVWWFPVESQDTYCSLAVWQDLDISEPIL
jgi:hypothetical protein